MRTSRFRKPSPSLAISIIALFVALSGSAYATTKIGTNDIRDGAITKVKLKKDSVATGKIRKDAVNTERIRKNSVITEKIRNSAITTEKIRGDAVTGEKVDESTLGEVPSAASAENATNWSRYGTSGLHRASVGQTVELASVGPFTFYGRCIDAGGPQREAEAFVTTAAPNSFMESHVKAFTEPEFEPGTEAKIGNSYAYNFPLWVSGIGSESEWTTASPDGSTLLRGNISWGLFVYGADCAYDLSWLNEA